mmetsp:Transcript_62172/g.183826  ORF Transcript_62172/g.183826 Transcript_62172/m.183826 type:complete len:234 (-) Transcript_62172:669-1370(-)
MVGTSEGCWIGTLLQDILKSNGEEIDRSTIRSLALEERQVTEDKRKLEAFDRETERMLGIFQDDTANLLTKGELPANDEPPDNEIDWQDVQEHAENEHEELTTEQSEQEKIEDDTLPSSEIIFPKGDGLQHIGKVIERKRGPDGNFIIGRRHDKPILDTREYIVQYSDGSEDSLTYAKVAGHLYSQVDAEGNQLHIYEGIVGHRKRKGDVEKADQFYERAGRRYKKRTTAVWF